MDTLTLGPVAGAQYLYGMCLMYDLVDKRAVWKHPVDAREGLQARTNEVTGEPIAPTLSVEVPEGVKIPPHPAPWAVQPGPIVPAVNEKAGTVAASAPASSVGATTPGPRIMRTAATAARPGTSVAPPPEAGEQGS